MAQPLNQLSQSTQTVYKWIIDDVVAKIKPEVLQEGLDESVLDDLRSLWEAKLMQKGLLDSDAPAAGAAGPSAAPAVVPAATLAGFAPGLAAAGFNAASFTAQLAAAAAAGNPAALAAHSAALAAHPAVLQAVAGIKRDAPDTGFDAVSRVLEMKPVIPQRDGAADEDQPMQAPETINPSPAPQLEAAAAQLRAAPRQARKASQGKPQQQGVVPQRDGPADEGEEGGEGGGEGEAAPEPASDEVLSEDDEEEEEEDEDQPNFLCCQFEKVGRTKNKWKVSLKEGVFHINGKDYLFKKGQGEWIF